MTAREKTMRGKDHEGRFGSYGGQYVPETLIPALDELEREYAVASVDPTFKRDLDDMLANYVGRPSPLSSAPRFSEVVGTNIWLKREDLNHTGAHKINNTVGQVLLARRMGKTRIIAETGAGQHGVATATVCARYGLACVVYMGEEDMRRQELNVFRMRLMGAQVVPVLSGTRTLKDATSEAIRDWVTNVTDSHYIIGSVVGPAPYPRMVATSSPSSDARHAHKCSSDLADCRRPSSPALEVGLTRWASFTHSYQTLTSNWSASRPLARASPPSGIPHP